MKRRTFLKSSLLLGTAGIQDTLLAQPVIPGKEHRHLQQKQDTARKKPHIVFIMTDQHRYDALECMGNPSVQSPHIDRLADEGTLFVSGYSSSPSSTPARAGLLTGMSPWHHGMLGYGKVAANYRYEMPRVLRNLGYYTYGIGKMHWFPQRSLHGFHGTLLDESGRVEDEGFVSDYRRWFREQAPGLDPDLTGIGWNDHAAGVYQLDEQLHPTAWTGWMAVDLIEGYNDDKPLFLKVSFARPHSPYDPPQRYLDMYKDVEIPAPWKGKWCTEDPTPGDPLQAAKDAPFGNFGDAYAQNSRRHYYASVTFIDDQVGGIIAALKQKGMYEDTLICFTSDHGDMLGDHHHWRKTYPYEGSAHIPYIVKWPAGVDRVVPAGSRLVQPVELRDFLPTFIEIAGGEVPPDMDGLSLLSLVRQDNPVWRDYIDFEHATCYRAENYWCALTDGKVKYVWNFYTGGEQLFDLVNDPAEIDDLSTQPDWQGVLEQWRQSMVNHLQERGEEFVKEGRLVVRNTTLLYSPYYPAG